jgi:hypothetical protein
MSLISFDSSESSQASSDSGSSKSCNRKSKKTIRYKARSLDNKLTVGRVAKSTPIVKGTLAKTVGTMLKTAAKRVPVIALLSAVYGVYKAAEAYEETGSLLDTGIAFVKYGLRALPGTNPESANQSTGEAQVHAAKDDRPAVLDFKFGIGSCEKGDYDEFLTTLKQGNFLTDGNGFDYNEWGLFNDSAAVIEEYAEDGVLQPISISAPAKIRMKLRLPTSVNRLEATFRVSLRDLVTKACGGPLGMDQVCHPTPLLCLSLSAARLTGGTSLSGFLLGCDDSMIH